MFYIISLKKNIENVIINYKAYDTCSGSTMNISPDTLKSIILKGKIKVVGVDIQNNKIVMHDWVSKIGYEARVKGEHETVTKFKGPKYILVATKGSLHKIVDYAGNVFKLMGEELNEAIAEKIVANCSVAGEGKDVYKIVSDTEFEDGIKLKYKTFLDKTNMLGIRDITFNYEIENKEVRLKKYTGTNKNVIVPSFITAICDSAFMNMGIESVKFSNGLKVIGERAFATARRFNGLSQVELPETVEFVGANAFAENKKLFNLEGTLNNDRFKVFSTKTVIVEHIGGV